VPSAVGERRILGLSAFHADASAAAVVDGRFVAGVEEERFRRIKHWAGFPEQALRFCLEEMTGGGLAAVTALAVARQPRAYLARKALLALSHPRSLRRALGRARNLRQVASLAERIAAAFGGPAPALHPVEHHLAHVASAFYCSPFEEAMCLTVDGFGDFVSTMMALGRGNAVEVLDRVHFPHSLGLFYTAVTQYLGFPGFGDEYKVMGLAAYGEPAFANEIGKLVPPRPRRPRGKRRDRGYGVSRILQAAQGAFGRPGVPARLCSQRKGIGNRPGRTARK